MTHRERVLAAIDHRRPDRVPMDFFVNPQTTAELMRALRVDTHEGLLRALDIDCRQVDADRPEDVIGPDGVKQNIWGERWVRRQLASGDSWVATHGALHQARTLADLRAFDWPCVDDVDYAPLAAQCDRYAAYATFYGNSDLWQRPALVRGMDNMFEDMMLRPEMAEFIIGRFTDYYCEDLTRALEASRGRIDVYWTISDLGTQAGPLMSLAMFRQWLRPPFERLIRIARSAGCRVMFHTCGSVRMFIPDLIEMGVDILDPVQVTAADMDPAELKREFGHRLCFHGGVDIQHMLPFATPQEVRSAVRNLINALGADGGYIVAATHEIQPDAPVDNVLAMYDEARQYTYN